MVKIEMFWGGYFELMIKRSRSRLVRSAGRVGSSSSVSSQGSRLSNV